VTKTWAALLSFSSAVEGDGWKFFSNKKRSLIFVVLWGIGPLCCPTHSPEKGEWMGHGAFVSGLVLVKSYKDLKKSKNL
jgi:hypothetical protein